jgi:Pyridoxamine 5'-phosphate oxidase-like
MALSAEDQRLLASMRQRELSLKKRQLAANAIFHESRRYRRVLVVLVTLAVACVVTGIILSEKKVHDGWLSAWRPAVLIAVISAVIGPLLGQRLLRTRPGRRMLANKGLRLNRKYIGDLHFSRRWREFYYQGEDISYYVPQILYVIESEQRFDSVREALEFAKQHHDESAETMAHELQQFNAVAAQTNLMVLSSVNARGRPSSRVMSFVKTERLGVWYVTTPPDTPKVRELDAGQVALVTVPTQDGATISSNHARIRRAGKTLLDVAGLYRSQAPGYLDGMTEEDQRAELVYELTLQSAKVDSWTSHDLVSLREQNASEVVLPQARSASAT